jgi:hypothetical protein
MKHTQYLQLDGKVRHYAYRYCVGELDDRQLTWWVAMENLNEEQVRAAIQYIHDAARRGMIKTFLFILGVPIAIFWLIHHFH